MIISASRRTDIPAFYAQWFINRIRAGCCTVPNPYNRAQMGRVSLLPEDVDVIAFWTRNPKPLFPYLAELDQRGYKYYFQITLLGYPRQIDPKSPSRKAAIQIFQALSERIGPGRVTWRYDPIVFSQLTGADFHRQNFAQIADALKGYTHRVTISVMDMYKKFHTRLGTLNRQGVGMIDHNGSPGPRYDALMSQLAQTARDHAMEIYSCAEERPLQRYGIRPGKCIDDDLIGSVFGVEVGAKKDPGQRKECGCVVSKDIGMYDTCIFGCQYCYATGNFNRAKASFKAHDPQSPPLAG